MHGKAAAIAGAAMILAGCGEATQPVATTTTVTITKTVTVTTPSPPFPPKTAMETDGMYRVGIDIVPGTYRSGGKGEETTDCFWARLRSLSEDDLIDSGMGAHAQLVLIEAGDKAFHTHNCQPWLKVG